VFDSNGARVFGPERWVFSGSSPIDLDTLTPTIVDPAFADPILSNPVGAQSINDFNLTLPLLNNIRMVDGVKFTTIQAAIDDLTTGASPGTVFVPAGTYSISASLLINESNMTLIGEGRNNTIINCSNTAVDAVIASGQKIRVRGIDIRYATAADAGTYAFRVTDLAESIFDDITIATGNVRNGILVEATAGAPSSGTWRNKFSNITVQGCAGNGWEFRGSGSGSQRVLDQNIIQSVVSGCDGDGVLIVDYVAAVRLLSGVTLSNNALNYHIAPTATGRTINCVIENSVLDNPDTSENINIDKVDRVRIVGNWIATTPSGKFNVVLGADADSCMLESNLISFALGGEVQVKGDNNTIRGNQIHASGTPPTNAVQIDGSASGTHVAMNSFRGGYTNDISDSGTSSILGPNFTDDNAGSITLASPLITTITNPLEGEISNTPRWIFKQVDFGDMTAGATADTFTLWTLPTNTMIHDIVGVVSTAWAGGSISAAVASVGTNTGAANDLTLDDNFFAAAKVYELHDATANGGKGALLFDTTDKFAPYMFLAGGVIELQMDLTGDNHANATAGRAKIYALVSQPLGNTTDEAN
jgi:hypothetical protein